MLLSITPSGERVASTVRSAAMRNNPATAEQQVHRLTAVRHQAQRALAEPTPAPSVRLSSPGDKATRLPNAFGCRLVTTTSLTGCRPGDQRGPVMYYRDGFQRFAHVFTNRPGPTVVVPLFERAEVDAEDVGTG